MGKAPKSAAASSAPCIADDVTDAEVVPTSPQDEPIAAVRTTKPVAEMAAKAGYQAVVDRCGGA